MGICYGFHMCGRYAQGKAVPEVVSRYARLGALRIASEQLLHPGFNVAPGNYAAVIHRDAAGLSLEPMRWGLVPRWAKSLESLKSKPINARSETADSGAMFRDAFRSSRCLVPAMGFFEWQGSKPPKQPWFIHARDQELLSFAGLCSRWVEPTSGTQLQTFTILTTDANEVVRPIHDRMPCILHPEEEEEWLAGSTSLEHCKALLRPYPVEETLAYRVSTAVNRPGGDGPSLIEPVAEPSENRDSWLF